MSIAYRLLPLALVATIAGCAASAPKQLAGVSCQSPPPLHCPDANCPGDLIANLGNATDPKTGRKFFLDYPCDLKPNEKVTFVLNLHGGGSIGNWQRHYFPIMDLKEKYRLVVATPSGVVRAWDANNDDAHLQNIVNLVYEQVGAKNIKAFWLAGHSQGGQTSNRLLATPFFKEKLTGWTSLSGGRLGSKRADIRAPIPANPGAALPAQPAGAEPRLVADAAVLPDYSFSHIYEAGEHEYPSSAVPKTSPWAQKLQCGPQTRRADVVDTQAGYINDSRVQQNPNKVWGLKARPGTAQVYVYPNCAQGRLVADIVRMDKGHTEGLEPHITEEIVKLMISVTR
ncbi:MAG TPA: alpha/beta hydrolase [Steroidobacteraceae bacterium]|nr:alpha/beta hydrolase [Steroidobacteraceae bacterium]